MDETVGSSFMRLSCCIPPNGKGLTTFRFLALPKLCQIMPDLRGVHFIIEMRVIKGEFDLPDSEVSVFDSRSLSDASRMLAFSSLIVSWGKLVS